MEPERWQQLEDLFFAALGLDSGERDRLLAGAEPSLAEEARAMLAAHESSESLAFEQRLVRDQRLGSRIGAYRLIERIGQGGMGEVFLAERADGQFEQRVAVKLLRAGIDGPEAIARFRAEREILARLGHPHIARLLDGGVTGEGLPFLAMEYVRGEPITQFCATKDCTVEERLRLFLAVCRAVHFAHQSLVVHRDLKPSNILVTERREVKLLDFGIAKLLAEGAGEAVTRTGLLLLTPEYASPEQVRGEGVTTATDVYALGLLLSEILTGQRAQPVTDFSPANIERVICSSEPVRPSLAAPAKARRLRGDLDTIVATALHKDPLRRYGSAEALAADVERHLAGLPIEARADSFSYRTGKFLRRHRLAALASAAVVAALVVGLLFALSGMIRAQRAEAEARREAATSRQISDLLIGIFEVNDPGESRGETVTARELLDRGAQRVRTQLKDQPAVQSSLLRTMADAYSKLGLFERAQDLLESDLEVQQALRGPEHSEVAATLSLLAGNANARGEHHLARDLAQRALTLLERTPDADPLQLARTVNNLGVAQSHLKDPETTQRILERALTLFEKARGPNHRDLVAPLNNLAVEHWKQNDFAGARSLYERALAILKRHYGEEHPHIASTLNNLALVEVASGRFPEARALHEQALSMRRALLAPDHPDIAESLNNLSVVLMRQGDQERARAALTECLAIREKALRPDHPLIGDTLYNLGLTLARLGDPDQARPLLERSAGIMARSLGPDHFNVSFPLETLAEIGFHTGDLATADHLSARVVELRTPSGPSNPNLINAVKLRARVLRKMGREAEAADVEKHLPSTLTSK